MAERRRSTRLKNLKTTDDVVHDEEAVKPAKKYRRTKSAQERKSCEIPSELSNNETCKRRKSTTTKRKQSLKLDDQNPKKLDPGDFEFGKGEQLSEISDLESLMEQDVSEINYESLFDELLDQTDIKQNDGEKNIFDEFDKQDLMEVSDFQSENPMTQDNEIDTAFEILDFLDNEVKGFENAETEEGIFDKTMYDPEDEPMFEKIPSDRDWDEGLADLSFDVYKQLQKRPIKSNLRKRCRTKPTEKLKTYKFRDPYNRGLIYVIDGYSQSTFIKQIITYLQTLTFNLEKIISNILIPGVNFEANLYINMQTITDLFREELVPMLTYSIYNKDLTNHHKSLMLQLDETIYQLLKMSIMNSEFYRYEKAKRYYNYDDTDEDRFQTKFERTRWSKFVENMFLFNAVMIHEVFMKRTHVSVMRAMFEEFQYSFHIDAEYCLTEY